MVEIEINGKKIEAAQGSMIIEVADQNEVRIPRFCYHKKLSVAANCRMCLVEVGDARKPMPACATPITQGMKVFTRSKLALDAQRAVMEFLLINHPLDCPVCDQGGECELQDLAVGYGRDVSRFNLGKRALSDHDIGPLIETEMTRCIHCTRCVRFGKEIAGLHELGVMNRGEHLEISTMVARTLTSELSGNMIDVCPVGALTSKPYRFTARAWELKQRPGMAAHDGVGSHIYAHVIHNQIKRVVPHECEALNETWLSDRDRFSYEGLYHADRLLEPKIKRNGRWEEADWSTALDFAADRLRSVIHDEGAQALGALASPNSSCEEFYLLQKLMRGIGSAHVDHRLRQQDFSDEEEFAAYPHSGVTLTKLSQADVILLLGSCVRKEQPIVAHRIRMASLNGAVVLVVNPMDYTFQFNVTHKQIVPGGDLLLGIAKIAKALMESSKIKPDSVLAEFLQTVTV
ncbi:MAG TPA: NADH-quinone oxidoreductase subunit NuoG, partial [Gammaproteobacteria bacterium]|nr:NADH-quinone oxidoreductase subunit NuoG [Gammaproteobacteria bacterium]